MQIFQVGALQRVRDGAAHPLCVRIGERRPRRRHELQRLDTRFRAYAWSSLHSRMKGRGWLLHDAANRLALLVQQAGWGFWWFRLARSQCQRDLLFMPEAE